MKKVLVVKLRQLGDVLLTTPVIRAIAEQIPESEVFACVNSGTEGILKDNPDLAGCFTVPTQRGMMTQLAFLHAIRRARFDLLIDLTGSDRSALLTGLSGARERWGYHRYKGFLGRNLLYTRTVRRKPGVHVIEQQAALLREYGIESPSPRLIFEVSKESAASVEKLLPPGEEFFHVHPVSRIMKKCWPAEFMAEVLDFIAARGLTPVITASRDPGERAWVADLLTKMKSPAVDLSGQLTLQELGALSQNARLFIGVDSAPMHIAAAVGAPVIGIFGPSSETLWAPWCSRKVILSRQLECRLPCKNKKACPHIECLRAMTPSMVLPTVTGFLDEVLKTGEVR